MDFFWPLIIQFITEFLPVSSSAHVVILSRILNAPSIPLYLQVSLNLITLTITLFYFHKDIEHLVVALWNGVKGRFTHDLKKFFSICIATLPVVIGGYLLHKYIGHLDFGFRLMGWTSIVMGTALIFADFYTAPLKIYDIISYKDAFIIGCLQIIALIPGASRLGTTLIGARLLGYKRYDAAKFSFLLSIPVGLGAFILVALKSNPIKIFSYTNEVCLMVGLAVILGYFSLKFFMWWIRHYSFLIWGLYRILFGCVILYYFT